MAVDDADDIVGPADPDLRFMEGETITYWVTTEPSMTYEEREQLEHELHAPDEGVEVQRYGAGPGMTEIELAFSLLANVVTTAAAATGAFGKIYKWLQQRKQEGKPVHHITVERTTVIREKIEVSGDNAEDLKRFFRGDNPDAE
jgi:hypothetical protein